MLIPSTYRFAWNAVEKGVLAGKAMGAPSATIALPWDEKKARPELRVAMLGVKRNATAKAISGGQEFELSAGSKVQMIERDARSSASVLWDSLADVPAFVDFAFDFGQEVTWHWQAALTLAEVAEGCHRPDDVVNSFAVYGRCGKIGHVYRAFVTAAGGMREWLPPMQLIDVTPTGGTIRETLPRKWLAGLPQSAWPVVKSGATIGYTSSGASDSAANANQVVASGPYVGAAGTTTSISVASGYSGANLMTPGLWVDSTSTPGAAVVSCAEAACGSGAYAFRTSNTATAASISAGSSYWIGYTAKSNTSRYLYDAWAGNHHALNAFTYVAGTIPDPFPLTGVTNAARRMSVYVTYTATVASGGGVINPVRGFGGGTGKFLDMMRL